MQLTTENLLLAFADILGRPAWTVRSGYGSFITLNFGQPFLHVREPISPDPNHTKHVKTLMARRRVFVLGEWHWWIHSCEWKIINEKTLLASNRSDKEAIEKACDFIDGQILENISYNEMYTESEFCFDLHARLIILSDKTVNDEQWLLYYKNNITHTLDQNGYLSACKG